MPPAVGAAQVIGDLAAVAVAHGGEEINRVGTRVELDLGDARKLAADHVRVARGRRAETMEVHLLEEVAILGRTLVALRIARVVEAVSIGRPLDAAASGRIGHTGNLVVEPFAARYVVDVRRAIFAAVLRQRHHDSLAVERRREEIDRGVARRIERIGIENDALAANIH